MLTPINPDHVPAGGWSVDLPDAGVVSSPHFADFKREVKRRLEVNGLDRHNWWAEIQDLMCRQRPDIPCEDRDAMPQRTFTGDDLARFLRTVWEWKDGGSQVVDEELQNRRLAVCLKCPARGYISCLIGCQQVSEWIFRFVEGRNLPLRDEIGKSSCTKCGCPCLNKTAMPIELIKAVDEKHQTHAEYASGCWILEESK